MTKLALFLRLVSPVFFIVGALHLTLGLGAEALLGAHVSADALSDPGLDSQNRFYGVAFTLYGVLLLLCSQDIPKYSTVLKCLLWAFFAAGMSRTVSLLTHGSPPPLIWALFAGEILPPPLLLCWLASAMRQSPAPTLT
jgi:hypothetical protein